MVGKVVDGNEVGVTGCSLVPIPQSHHVPRIPLVGSTRVLFRGNETCRLIQHTPITHNSITQYLDLMMKLEHYLKSLKRDHSKFDPETLAGIEEWNRKLESGEVTIHKLTDHPFERNSGQYITEFLDMLGMFGDDEEEKQAWLAEGNEKFRPTIYQTPFLLSPRLREAIDALPGEFIYLRTDYDSEEQFEGIISLMKLNVRCEKTSVYGFSDGEQIREFTSSAEVVEFLEEKYAALKTYHDCGTVAEILAVGSFTVDYLRTQMLKEKLTSLKVRLGESGEEIELPITTVRAENDCDCYHVVLKGTAVEAWLERISDQNVTCDGAIIACDSFAIRCLHPNN